MAGLETVNGHESEASRNGASAPALVSEGVEQQTPDNIGEWNADVLDAEMAQVSGSNAKPSHSWWDSALQIVDSGAKAFIGGVVSIMPALLPSSQQADITDNRRMMAAHILAGCALVGSLAVDMLNVVRNWGKSDIKVNSLRAKLQKFETLYRKEHGINDPTAPISNNLSAELQQSLEPVLQKYGLKDFFSNTEYNELYVNFLKESKKAGKVSSAVFCIGCVFAVVGPFVGMAAGAVAAGAVMATGSALAFPAAGKLRNDSERGFALLDDVIRVMDSVISDQETQIIGQAATGRGTAAEPDGVHMRRALQERSSSSISLSSDFGGGRGEGAARV